MATAEQIARLKEKIRDLKARLPAHSVRPAMLQELESLEEELARLKQLQDRRAAEEDME